MYEYVKHRLPFLIDRDEDLYRRIDDIYYRDYRGTFAVSYKQDRKGRLFNFREGADWVEKALGWTTQIVRHPSKLAPEEVMSRWVREWAREGVAIDPEKLSGSRRFGDLPRWWVVERTFSWLGQSRRMSEDYERLPESSEAFVYVAMSRLMLRRLARS